MTWKDRIGKEITTIDNNPRQYQKVNFVGQGKGTLMDVPLETGETAGQSSFQGILEY